MVTLLYRAKANGFICKRIAAASKGRVRTLRDRDILPPRVEGTLIRWDSRVELDADITLNKAQFVGVSRNKAVSRLYLDTLAPPTWFKKTRLEFPCLLRPARHHAAQHFFICKNLTEARAAIRQCKRRKFLRYYASPIIDRKLEFRVFIFQDYVVKVIRRYHEDPAQLAWNAAEGGKSTRIRKESWPINVCHAAIKGARTLGLHFAAIDVIVDQSDRPFVLEANTAPGLAREATIKSFAKLFAWAGANPQPALNPLGATWQSITHPAFLRED